MADLKAMAEELVNLTVKEVNELAEILKDEYGIEPAAAAVAVAGPAGGGEGGDTGKTKREARRSRSVFLHRRAFLSFRRFGGWCGFFRLHGGDQFPAASAGGCCWSLWGGMSMTGKG